LNNFARFFAEKAPVFRPFKKKWSPFEEIATLQLAYYYYYYIRIQPEIMVHKYYEL